MDLVSAPLDPTQLLFACCSVYNDDATVITSNVSSSSPLRQLAGFATQTKIIDIDNAHGIPDTSGTLVFVKTGVPVDNKQPAANPLTVNLPDGHQVKSTHTCDVVVPGLHHPLVGHIVPNLAIASLFGIRPLCNAGCTVVFHKNRVDVWYDGKLILMGPRNMSTDLWTLPFTNKCNMSIPPATPRTDMLVHPALASYTHSIRMQMNAIRVSHQSLGNPHISTLLKAVRHGFLNGCPNISGKLVLKYLNPSLATAKGHMKRPCHGICSMTPKGTITTDPDPVIDDTPIQLVPPPRLVASNDEWDKWAMPPPGMQLPGPNVIINNDMDESIVNIFAFGTLADKNSGIVYHNLMGLFPFMLLDSSVCFFVLYHYKSNCILADLIKALEDKLIFETYKQQFEMLTKKGFQPKLNVMDNQATKYIKEFLTKTSESYSSFSHPTIVSTPLNGQSRRSRTHLLLPSLQRVATSPSNYGIN
jgi:hypothetical protein